MNIRSLLKKNKKLFSLSKAFDLSLEVLKFDIEEVINEVGKKISRKLNEKQFKKYLILIGPGNNGCDGLATIKFLKTENKVQVYLYENGKNFKHLNKKFLKNLRNKIELISLEKIKTYEYDCIVEAFFGTGFKGNLNSEATEVLKICSRKNAFKISIDVPVKNFKADLTYSINEKKAKNAELIILSAYEKMENEYISFLDLLKIRTFEKERKCLNGKLLIIAGSAKYLGSLYFASYCASQFCDLVYYHCPEQKNNMANEIPEAIPLNDLHEIKQKIKENYFDAILVGPGLTKEKKKELEEILDLCLEKRIKLILDAFGIDMIKEKVLNEKVLITPHRGEFKRVFEKEANLESLKEIT
ncbi:MAG: NAD(P)H-hydrate dehydratase, partial [Candidatus Anstonellales archaeon]